MLFLQEVWKIIPKMPKSRGTTPLPSLVHERMESLPRLLRCNVSCGLSAKYVCEYMSDLFDVRVVTMTFLFVNSNSIDTICIGHDVVP